MSGSVTLREGRPSPTFDYIVVGAGSFQIGGTGRFSTIRLILIRGFMIVPRNTFGSMWSSMPQNVALVRLGIPPVEFPFRLPGGAPPGNRRAAVSG